MEFSFSNSLFEWRGPAPFYFLRVPQEISDEIKVVSNEVSYGWGVIPITGRVDGFGFTTALIPREGVYYLPIKMAVQKKFGLEVGDEVQVEFDLGARK